MVALGTALVGGAGVKFVDLFLKRGVDVAKTSIRERSKRVIADIELTGEAQRDIATIAQYTMRELRATQDEATELYGKIASLETANNVLRSSFDKMKMERDKAIAENVEFIKRVTELITQAKDLQTRLAKEVMAHAKLAIEYEGAKERVMQQQKTIEEMRGWIAEAQQREAALEAELEHARTS